MDLILFFVVLKWGLTGIAAAFTIALIIDVIAGAIFSVLDGFLGLICVAIDIILFFVFRHFGYPIKPMLWTFLICSAVGLNPVMAVLNIIGIILFYAIIF